MEVPAGSHPKPPYVQHTATNCILRQATIAALQRAGPVTSLSIASLVYLPVPRGCYAPAMLSRAPIVRCYALATLLRPCYVVTLLLRGHALCTSLRPAHGVTLLLRCCNISTLLRSCYAATLFSCYIVTPLQRCYATAMFANLAMVFAPATSDCGSAEKRRSSPPERSKVRARKSP